MKKPDRFERAVRENQRHDGWGIAIANADDVSKLLRKEHAWFRQIVKSHDLPYEEYVNADYQRGFLACVDSILQSLETRRK